MNKRENASTKADEEGSEEGEIVDSDEEQNILRQRIKELEARNDELQKISEISNQYRYATNLSYRNRTLQSNTKQTFMSQKDVARIPSDASSISSDEIIPKIKKRTKRKGRHSKKEKEHCRKHSRSSSLYKNNQRIHKSESKIIKSQEYCRKHHKLRLHKMKSPLVVNENYLETISLDSDEDLDRQKADENNSDNKESKNRLLYLNRAELRFALARDRTNETKPTGNLLKERLYNGHVLLDPKESIKACDVLAADSLDTNKSESTCKPHVSEKSVENSDKDECATQEEQELRLIALKSAILKKHFARKKRNAEMAYSPTDFAPVTTNPIIADDNMDVVEDELDELNDVMEISPINSPKLILTPTNDDDHSDFKAAGDNNSIDMDIAQSGSEEEIYNNNNQWHPIETEPTTTQSAECNDTLKYPLPIHYGIYVPEMQYQFAPQNTINKPSQLIYNEERLPPPNMNMFRNLITDEEPPPPPSMYFTISDDDENHLPPSTLDAFCSIFSDVKFDEEPPPPPPFFPENANNTNNIFQRLGAKTENNSNNFLLKNEVETFPQNPSSSKSDQGNIVEVENEDSDEEASALRAILLSKLQASKNQKKENKVKEVSQQLLPSIESVSHTEEQSDKNGIETVLQKALKRLKSSSSSSKENDARAQADDCINTETLTAEVVNLNLDTKKYGNCRPKSLPCLEKEPGSFRNRLKKNIGSKQRLHLDEDCQTNLSLLSTVSDPSDLQTKEKESCPSIVTENSVDFLTNAEATDASFNRCYVTTVAEQNEYGIKISTVPSENDIDNTSNKTIAGTNENKEDALKQKSEYVKSFISKNSSGIANIKNKESTLKRKSLTSVVLQTASTRGEPLSVKNNLLPTTLRSGKNFLKSTLDKSRTTRTTKIIRPNKVINKEITTNIKRAITPSDSPTPPAKIQRTTVNTSTKSTNSNSDVLPKITVKKLIINLRASDTESSENELPVPEVPVHRANKTFNEIASPLELLMDSASCSPVRSKHSAINGTSTSTRSVISVNAPATNAAFEKKLDAFLKGIRKKGSLECSSSQSQKRSPIKTNEITKNLNTPSAVRHLPLASQDEYRRLVHKMKMLEKQKQTKHVDEGATTQMSALKNIPETAANSIERTEEIDNAENAIKGNLQLKKLLSYENCFEQTSDNIVRLLNKSLSLVEEAKKAKFAKLQYEQKIQELRAEMTRLQLLFDQEEQKFSSVKPQIGASNQFLTSLKKKRRNLMDNAIKLGTTLKGDKYRLVNKTGEEIIAKSRKLHAEIKFVNSMKTDNIKTFLLLHSGNSKETSESATDGATMQSDVIVEKNNVMNCNQEELPETGIQDDAREEVEKKTNNEVPKESEECSHEIPNTKYQNFNDENSNQMVETSESTADQNSEHQLSDAAEIVENEMRVELEVQHENITEEINDQHLSRNSNSKSVVPKYISPLDHFRHQYSNIDVNAIVCPYEMWGKCADESCSYMHMTKGKKRGTELAFTLLNEENVKSGV